MLRVCVELSGGVPLISNLRNDEPRLGLRVGVL